MKITKRKQATVSAAMTMAAALAATASMAHADPMLDGSGLYTQNFDTLSNTGTANAWINDSTLPGWYATESGGTGNFPGTYRADNGNSTAGALYSYGATGDTDRALGSLASGTTGSLMYGLVLQVAAGFSISDLTINYTGEQWRNGGNASEATQKLTFDYVEASSLPTLAAAATGAVTSLNFVSPNTTSTTGVALNGNDSGNQTALTGSIGDVLTSGEFILLRWTDINDTGNDHALALDNLSITWTPTATGGGPLQLLWTGGNATWGQTVAQFENTAPNDTIWSNTANGNSTIAAFNTLNTIGVDAGGITTNGLNFETGSTGTLLTGPGTLTMNGNGITIAASTSVTIGTKIAGTAGISLLGSGTLTLTNTGNSYTGNVAIGGPTLVIGADSELGDPSNTITLSGNGTLRLTAPMTESRQIIIAGVGTLDDQGNNITLNDPLSGSGAFNKVGGGTLNLAGSAASGQYSGSIALTAGELRITAADSSSGITGAGNATVTAADGTTISIEGGLHVGRTGTGAVSAPSFTLTPGTVGATLQVSGGPTIIDGGTQSVANVAGTVHIKTLASTDSLLIGTAMRGGGNTTPTISVEGPGTVQIASGGISGSATGTQFNGKWEVALASGGILSFGPIQSGGAGEILNSPGYAPPAVGVIPTATVYAGQTNPIDITSGTVAFGADVKNPNYTNSYSVVSFRSPLTLNGGAIASTGTEIGSSTVVAANISADITLAAGKTSTVSLFDPVAMEAGTDSTGRSLNFMNDPNAFNQSGNLTAGTGTSTPVSSNLTWGAGSTLIVDATGVTAGTFGALNIVRNVTGNGDGSTTSVVTVGSGATLQINTNAVVNLGGTLDALEDSSTLTNVNVTNNGTFEVQLGAKDAGAINGTGSTIVDANSTSLTADHVVQSSLTVDTELKIRSNGTNTGTSKVSSLTLAGTTSAWTAGVDLTNNRLIVEDSTNHATTLATVKNEVKTATTTTGILSSTAAAAGKQVAVVDNNILKLTSFGGSTVDSGSILVDAVFPGDTNLDGVVNISDLNVVAANWQKSVTDWSQGDFNGDGIVNISDLNVVAANWQKGAGGGSSFSDALASVAFAPSIAVPEPASLALMGVGAVMLSTRRRNKR